MNNGQEKQQPNAPKKQVQGSQDGSQAGSPRPHAPRSRVQGSQQVAKVTDLAVRNLQAQEGRYIAWFPDGFGVRVAPTGRKAFIYWYPFEGRKRMFALGNYPSTTVKQAIEAHTAARMLVQRGIDPAAKVADDKAARVATQTATQQAAAVVANRPTLRSTFDRWQTIELKPTVDADGQRHGRKDGGASMRQQFAKHVFPTLGDVALADVSRAAVLEMLDTVKAAGTRRTAAVLFSSLRQFLDWCVERELLEHNPMGVLRRAKIVGRATSRTRALAGWEITRLLARLPHVGMHPITVLALRFVLATGQRPGEVAGMPKSELDHTGTLWTIPAARYKTGIVQTVPLSKHARRILAEAASYSTASDYVFPSPQSVLNAITLGAADTEDKPVDRHSLSRAVLRKLGDATPEQVDPADGVLGLAQFRPHDLRRTCRTHLAALRVPDAIAERVLGHRPTGMVSVYDQHDYQTETREALELWGAKLDTLVGYTEPVIAR